VPSIGRRLRRPLGELKTSTAELVRALIVTAAQAGRTTRRAPQPALYHQIAYYIQMHLSERDLGAQRIARAQNISVRKLYQVWSRNDLPLAEWILSARLECARVDLRRPEPTSISQIAVKWGFADASHFSRRFRLAYGQTPREWCERGEGFVKKQAQTGAGA
jgi:AraC-like DNA-binding protein